MNSASNNISQSGYSKVTRLSNNMQILSGKNLSASGFSSLFSSMSNPTNNENASGVNVHQLSAKSKLKSSKNQFTDAKVSAGKLNEDTKQDLSFKIEANTGKKSSVKPAAMSSDSENPNIEYAQGGNLQLPVSQNINRYNDFHQLIENKFGVSIEKNTSLQTLPNTSGLDTDKSVKPEIKSSETQAILKPEKYSGSNNIKLAKNNDLSTSQLSVAENGLIKSNKNSQDSITTTNSTENNQSTVQSRQVVNSLSKLLKSDVSNGNEKLQINIHKNDSPNIANITDYQNFNKFISSNLNYNIFNPPTKKESKNGNNSSELKLSQVHELNSESAELTEQKPVAVNTPKDLKLNISDKVNTMIVQNPKLKQNEIKMSQGATEKFSLSDYLQQKNVFAEPESKNDTSKASQKVKFDIPLKLNDENISKVNSNNPKTEISKVEIKQNETVPQKAETINSVVENFVNGNNLTEKKVIIKSGTMAINDNMLKIKDLQTISPRGIGAFVLKQIAETAGNSISTAQLTLKPESLGMLFVEISVKDNIANVSFSTKTQEAMKAIESQIPVLKDKLSQIGLQSDRIEVKVKEDEYTGTNSKNTGDKANEHYDDSQTRKDFVKSFGFLRNTDLNGLNINNEFSPYYKSIINKFSVV